MDNIENYRKFDRYRDVHVNVNNVYDLKTSIDVSEELWSIIKSVSEVKERGIKLVAKYGVNGQIRQEKIYKKFQAFVRQGENYFLSAKNLSYRSSALLYYYSFLNLAKAYIILRQPDLPDIIKHGLFYKISRVNTDLTKQFVSIPKGREIFSRLYELELNSARNMKRFNISQLFSYIEDIAQQYESAGYGLSRINPCVLKVLGNNRKNEWWTIVGILKKAEINKYKKSFKNFFKNFDFLDIPDGEELLSFRNTLKKNFNINPWEAAHFNYYQNKKVIHAPDNLIPVEELISEIYEAFSSSISEKYYSHPYDFYLNLPYRQNNQIVVNEFIAIYIIMFFLSSLVRYYPAYLEEIFESKDAWLIESFVKACPLKFLRIITSKILGETYILSSL